VMQVLKNMINLVSWLETHQEFLIVGLVLLVAVMVDEIVKRRSAKKRII